MADSQRKTANLFDMSFYEGKSGITVSGNKATGTCDRFFNVKLSIPPELYGQELTWSAYLKRPDNPNTVLLQTADNGSYKYGNNITGEGRSTVSFTATSTIRLYVNYANTGSDTIELSDIMLNTGSTPLPYEPYGWIHSLRKLTTATDTITTLPADLYADGQSATVGILGNMSQTDTPTPTTPIQPSETGERTGNLLYLYKAGYRYDNSATEIQAASANIYAFDVDSGNTYTISAVYNTSVGASTLHIFGFKQGVATTITISNVSDLPYTYTVSSDIDEIRLSLSTGATSVMANAGSQPLHYEPYGIKIPISSANTTTPVYLGEVESTRKIKKLVLDGTEGWTLQGSTSTRTVCTIVVDGWANEVGKCTHIDWKSSYTTENNRITYYNRTLYIAIENSVLTEPTLAGFIAYLAQQYAAGTPVCVWYVLATPQTAVVNEPLRKIGAYADTVSVISIPTITGKDTFDVLTTLKPSEVELTYTGWHDASVKEWDGSQWQ